MLHGQLLLTGGADSSVKCWRLADWLPPEALAAHYGAGGAAAGQPGALGQTWELPEIPGLGPCAASSSQAEEQEQQQQQPEGAAAAEGEGKGRRRGAVDSKAEWVRCLALADQRLLYVGTNRGAIHRLRLPPGLWGSVAFRRVAETCFALKVSATTCLSSAGFPAPSRAGALLEEKGPAAGAPGGWETLHASAPAAPLHMLAAAAERPGGGWHWVAACNYAGRAVVLRVPAGGGVHGKGAASTWEWQPYGGRFVVCAFCSYSWGS